MRLVTKHNVARYAIVVSCKLGLRISLRSYQKIILIT
nr:MAG TPA: hypothetical protein [Caudoviricetes sp.]